MDPLTMSRYKMSLLPVLRMNLQHGMSDKNAYIHIQPYAREVDTASAPIRKPLCPVLLCIIREPVRKHLLVVAHSSCIK